jgi:hypothetical protein
MPKAAILEVLYVSVLAPDQRPTVVGQIVTQARARNAQRAITGLLVFDGIHFCQLIEGPVEAVQPLMEGIRQDPRHQAVRVLYEGRRDARRYQRFDLGFAQSDEPHDMAGIQVLEGTAALERFLVLRPSFDISG